MSTTLARVLLVTFSACSLAGCAASGALTPSPVQAGSSAPAAAQTAPVTFEITWPRAASASASAGHRPAYISKSIMSLTVSVNGNQLLEADNPATVGSPPVTQSYTLVAPIATDTFVVKEFDATGGAGNVLGRAMPMLAVQMSVANVLKITLDGQLASIGVTAVANPYLETGVTGANFTLVGPLAQTFVLSPLDAKGNTIVSPGVVPTLSLSSATQAIAATPVTGTSNAFAIQGPAPTTAIALTATGNNLDGVVVKATFTVQIFAALFVTDPVAHRVAVLDDEGNLLPFPSTAFPDIADTHNCGPHGIAYVAPTASNATPELYVTRCVGNPSNGGPGNLGIYDLLGNEITPATPFAPNLPQFATYDPRAGGRIIVADSGNVQSDPSIEFYDLQGNLTSSNAGAHPRAFEQANAPNKIAFDPSLASPDYLITDGTGFVERYSTSGTFVSKTAAGSSPGGITYDTNKKLYYVTTYGSVVPGNAPVMERGTVFAFDATLAQQTTGTSNALAFMGLSRSPTDIVFDPYNNVLYVADYAGNKLVTFNEDGSSSTQFASAVTSVVDPLGLALAP